jgi:hypothetical protein
LAQWQVGLPQRRGTAQIETAKKPNAARCRAIFPNRPAAAAAQPTTHTATSARSTGLPFCGQYSALSWEVTERERQHLESQHDGGIAYLDTQIGKLMGWGILYGMAAWFTYGLVEFTWTTVLPMLHAANPLATAPNRKIPATIRNSASPTRWMARR